MCVDELGTLGHRPVGVPCLGEVGSVGHEDGTEHDFVVQEVAPEDLGGADNGEHVGPRPTSRLLTILPLTPIPG